MKHDTDQQRALLERDKDRQRARLLIERLRIADDALSHINADARAARQFVRRLDRASRNLLPRPLLVADRVRVMVYALYQAGEIRIAAAARRGRPGLDDVARSTAREILEEYFADFDVPDDELDDAIRLWPTNQRTARTKALRTLARRLGCDCEDFASRLRHAKAELRETLKSTDP